MSSFIFIFLVWHVADTSQMLTELKKNGMKKLCKGEYIQLKTMGWAVKEDLMSPIICQQEEIIRVCIT